jgi:hypothetical protein
VGALVFTLTRKYLGGNVNSDLGYRRVNGGQQTELGGQMDNATEIKELKDLLDEVNKDIGSGKVYGGTGERIVEQCAEICREYALELGGLKSGIAEECARRIESALMR